MKAICEHLKGHVSDVLVEWEQLVREQPWYSLPPDHRIDSLPDVIVGLVEASLCAPADVESHRRQVAAATEHGWHRRIQEIPEHLLLTEYHLLRQAIWYYLVDQFGSSDRTTAAIMRIDIAITVATNASMWGYYRSEIEALGRWNEGMERIVSTSPLLREAQPAGGGEV
jgi:hypothetical protein